MKLEEGRIEEAKKYISLVVDQMAMADSDLKRIIKVRAEQIMAISLQYDYLGKTFTFSADRNLEREVEEILSLLSDELFEIIYNRCINVEQIALSRNEKPTDYSSSLFAFIGSKIADSTLEKRILQYVDYMKYEVETYAVIGIHKGMTQYQIVQEYLINLSKPYQALIFKEIVKEGGFSASRIVSKGITFGTGKYIAAFNNLKMLEQDTINKAYNHVFQQILESDPDYIGWYTVRGSNFDCHICDSMVGVVHKKNEPYFGYHTRCVCPLIPVYKS